MEITFEKVNEHRYEACFEAPGDFNLHVERVKNGTLEVYQRGIAEGEYDFAWSAGIGARKVIDYDFAAFVYPKWIKVVSSSEVVSASVNFNEGGGSGSGSGSELKWEYYRINHSADKWDFLLNTIGLATYVNFHFIIDNVNEIRYIGSVGTEYIEENMNNVYKIACSNIPLCSISRFGEYYADEGSWKANVIKFSDGDFDEELFDAVLTPITKEEFYTFDNDNAPV